MVVSIRGSYKLDVYKYEMMVLEMVGGWKNIDINVDFTSEIYFPHWFYKRLELNEELGLLGLLKEGDEDTARKMIIVIFQERYYVHNIFIIFWFSKRDTTFTTFLQQITGG